MDCGVFTFTSLGPDTIIPSARIARLLAERLSAPLTCRDDVGTPRVLVIVGGAYAFSRPPILAALGAAIEAAERVIWVQNDYTVIPPRTEGDAKSPFRRAFVIRTEQGKSPPDYWSTCERWARMTPRSRYVNWNALAWGPLGDEEVAARRRTENGGLLYYGAFRDTGGKTSRRVFFDRYFSSPAVPTFISGTSDKFEKTYRSPNVHHLPKFQGALVPLLASYGAGLYVQDRLSNEEFHSPANRFYEMLSAGLPIIFQPECGAVMRRAGIDPTPWMAATTREVARLFEQREWIGIQQRTEWGRRDHRAAMEQQMGQAIAILEESLS